MKRPAALLLLLLTSCGGTSEPEPAVAPTPAAEPAPEGEDHEHEEFSLGEIDLDGLSVALAQGHGGVVAGKEAHLVVKLPYSDLGVTVVRAWIGTEDRTLSRVGKGEYARSHDDYDLHALAPDPLPDDPRWWIELEKPDGTRSLGSAVPLFD